MNSSPAPPTSQVKLQLGYGEQRFLKRSNRVWIPAQFERLSQPGKECWKAAMTLPANLKTRKDYRLRIVRPRKYWIDKKYDWSTKFTILSGGDVKALERGNHEAVARAQKLASKQGVEAWKDPEPIRAWTAHMRPQLVFENGRLVQETRTLTGQTVRIGDREIARHTPRTFPKRNYNVFSRRPAYLAPRPSVKDLLNAVDAIASKKIGDEFNEAVFVAAFFGNEDLVNDALEAAPKEHAALHSALAGYIEGNHLKAVKEFSENERFTRYSFLVSAVNSDSIEMLDYLLERGYVPKYSFCDHELYDAFIMAAKNRNRDILMRLQETYDFDRNGKNLETVFEFVIDQDDWESAALLVSCAPAHFKELLHRFFSFGVNYDVVPIMLAVFDVNPHLATQWTLESLPLFVERRFFSVIARAEKFVDSADTATMDELMKVAIENSRVDMVANMLERIAQDNMSKRMLNQWLQLAKDVNEPTSDLATLTVKMLQSWSDKI